MIKVGRLKEILENIDPNMDVFIAKQKRGSFGNIMHLDQVEKSSYMTFGIKEDCVILQTEYSKPEMVDDFGEIDSDFVVMD